MEILSFQGGDSSSPKKKKSLKVILGLSVIAGVAVFGSTLAASVTINSGAAFQFGQGIVTASACDSAITVAATNTFTNATGGTGTFKVNTVTVSGIADACDGKTFKISAYNDTANSTALNLVSGSVTAALFTYNKTTPASSTGKATGTTLSGTASTDAGSVTITIDTPYLDASTVNKLTLEEQ